MHKLHFHLREEALKVRNFISFIVELTAILIENKIFAEFVRKIIKTSISRTLFKNILVTVYSDKRFIFISLLNIDRADKHLIDPRVSRYVADLKLTGSLDKGSFTRMHLRDLREPVDFGCF